jgi:imidazolonepropionase-like amidohydrolase
MRSSIIHILFILTTGVNFAQTYITNVAVADVGHHRYLADQTVVIHEGVITDVFPSGSAHVPSNATKINGAGKFLIPGLVDAHIHFSQTGGLYTRPDAIDLRSIRPYQQEIDWGHEHMEETLRRYLMNGITTVIDVGTTVNYVKHKASFTASASAPSIFMSGPLITTYEPPAFANLGDDGPFQLVRTIEEGKESVRKQVEFHPDFIKIWFIVGHDAETDARKYLPIVKAVIDESHRHKIKVAVHATERITAQLAVENGCDYLVHIIDDEVVPDAFVQLLKKTKTVLCPTLHVHNGYVKTFGQRLEISAHEIRMSDPYQLGTLLDLKHLPDTGLVNSYKTYANEPGRMAEKAQHWEIMMTNLKKLTEAGVLIATGTDAGNIGTMHASSYLTELKAMQKAGMSNWQILEASTLNGAIVLGREKEFGTIAKGKLANLVLLEADPIESIDNLTHIRFVMNKGIVIDPDTLLLETPEALVQRQLNAYNFRNMEAFLETYAEDVEVYDYPDKLISTGKAEIRNAYAPLFDFASNLHAEILERKVDGNIISDKEKITIGENTIVITTIYHVEGGLIKKVIFKKE